MTDSCPICFALLSNYQQPRPHTAIQCKFLLTRYALNNKGTVGSLYDCWIDNVSRVSSVEKNFIIEKDVKTSPKCEVINGDSFDNGDFLQIIDVENELWLSIVLGMPSVVEGSAMLYTYQLPAAHSVRFLHYYHIDNEICLYDDAKVVKHVLNNSLKNTKATHIITSVQRGIDFVIALEFPRNKNSSEIDSILEKVRKFLIGDDTIFFSSDEEQIINSLTTTIFSQITEIHALQDTKNLNEIFQCIRRYLSEQKYNIPLIYTLHPVKIPHSYESLDGGEFTPFDSTIIEKIRSNIMKSSKKLKSITYFSNEIRSIQLSEHLRIRCDDALTTLQQVNDTYIDFRNQIATKVLEFRRGEGDLSLFNKLLKDLNWKTLNDELDTLLDLFGELKDKNCFIDELKTKYGFEYLNVAGLEDKGENQQSLEKKIVFCHDQQEALFFCSSDELMKANIQQYNDLCRQSMEQHKTNSSMRLVFADFSYCKFILPNMKLLPSNLKSSISSVTKTSSTESNELNILLLGETGVGKSTFINAFVNYLAHQTFEKAEKDGPIVLIPVSFVMTSNNQFDEYDVKLGDHSNSNEDFDHPGQTITQYCESYTFDLDNKTKLRIIDTPGIGDTRGLSQDDKNIQYILSYVSNLSHLNAICILLKPNTTRLHVLFRSCFEQIFNFLGPNARDNIIFCFTNSRSTFYLPGNTSSLLKKMLNDLPADCSPELSKKNMFCFDSESFRYLAVNKTQKNIEFGEDQKTEFGTSWNKSVTESIRLIKLIKSCPKYQMNVWHSIKHAQIIITSLVRPILETIRNAVRNLILWQGHWRYVIKLNAKYISQPSYLCTACPYDIKQIEDFPFIKHSFHQYRKSGECDSCPCKYNEHIPVLYEVKYKSNTTGNNGIQTEVEDICKRLIPISVTFAGFLLHTARTNEDPFLSWLDLFIREELHLCSQQSSNILNTELQMQLIDLKDEYEKQLHDSKHNQQQTNIDEIYERIEKVQELPEINEQMDATKKSQIEIMKNHEHDVSLQYPDINMSVLLTDSSAEN